MKVSDDLMKEISLSPFIGLILDESTEIKSTQYLTVNIKYSAKGKVKEKFCALLELKYLHADGIFSVLLDFLKRYELLNKIVAISTDGTRVMLSDANGVMGS